MTDKEFRYLRRAELIEIIHKLQEEGEEGDDPEEPTREQVEKERARLRYNARFKQVLASTVAILIVVAAAAILIVTLFFPVLQVSGTSMEPTLEDGDVILLIKGDDFKTGDLVGIRYEGKVLLKRVIAGPGDYVSIDDEGNVFVNNELLDEPYVTDKSLGKCDMQFPYQVPENSWFVLGDHRSVSVDSRSSTIGCIRDEQIIGKIIMRIWPLSGLKWTWGTGS